MEFHPLRKSQIFLVPTKVAGPTESDLTFLPYTFAISSIARYGVRWDSVPHREAEALNELIIRVALDGNGND